jgi:hypothetical protein
VIDLLNNPLGLVKERGYAGQIADLNTAITISRLNIGLTPIDFGVAVARGPTAGTCKAVAADTDVIIGFASRYAMRPYDPTTGDVKYAVNETVVVAKQAFMLVIAKENAAEGDAVISLTAQAGALGSTTGGAAGTGRVAITGAKWAEPVTAGSIGLIEFNKMGV